MAGMGKRMRPHTLTVPKPLIPVAGKPIVQHLVEDIAAMCREKIDEVAFIIGNFGEATEKKLLEIAESIGARGKIFYQEEALGTAHAVHCAKECLNGNIIVAFADTIFRADFQLDTSKDGVIWVSKVDNPQQFGVVKLDQDNHIQEFVEKPSEFVSDLAIIGIYYFRDGLNLCKEIEYLMDNGIMEKGEYQLTNALENMKNKGLKFQPGKVDEWLDCGNKSATVHTNQRVLEIKAGSNFRDSSASVTDSVIIPPVFIGKNVKITNSVIGPHVSIGESSIVEHSLIKNSIVQNSARISEANIFNSMLGNFCEYRGKKEDLSISDYSTID
jgi:glucose-1-phosphate thymidylyltransferase